MKKLIKNSIIIFVIMYFIFSFIFIEIDFTEWKRGDRFLFLLPNIFYLFYFKSNN